MVRPLQVAPDLHFQGHVLFGAQGKIEIHSRFRRSVRRYVGFDQGFADNPVQPLISQHNAIVVKLGGQAPTALLSSGAPNLKNVSIVRIESNSEGNLQFIQPMVHEMQLLET